MLSPDVTITSPAGVDIDRNVSWGAEAGASQDVEYPYYGLPKNSCSMHLHGDTDGNQILKVVQPRTTTSSGRRNARLDQSDLDPVI